MLSETPIILVLAVAMAAMSAPVAVLAQGGRAPQTIIGKHTLGETLPQWFAAEEIDLALACQQNQPDAALQLRRVFLLTPEKLKAKDLAKATTNLCRTLLQVHSSGVGTLKPQQGDAM